jgi:hypothetical protein
MSDISINNKPVYVLDNLLERYQIEDLNTVCVTSKYTPMHNTSVFTHEADARFVCHLDPMEFASARLGEIVKTISNNLKTDLYVGMAYINHYGQMAKVGRHTDWAFDNGLTILIFVNYFWESTWGGEIKFYNEGANYNYCIDFVPGRIIVFDSRLEHEVLPLTAHAKKDRFSIALKCLTDNRNQQPFIAEARYSN